MPHELSMPMQVALLEAMGIDTRRMVKAVLTFEVRQAPKVEVTRLHFIDGAMVERIEALQLRAVASGEGMAPVSGDAAAPSMSTSGGN